MISLMSIPNKNADNILERYSFRIEVAKTNKGSKYQYFRNALLPNAGSLLQSNENAENIINAKTEIIILFRERKLNFSRKLPSTNHNINRSAVPKEIPAREIGKQKAYMIAT